MDTIFDFLKQIMLAGFSIWMFITFGLPLIISIIALFVSGFLEDGFLSWRGRLNRCSYIVNIIIGYMASLLGYFIIAFALPRDYTIFSMFGFIVLFLALFRVLAMTARRLHDLNLPGVIALALYAFNIIFENYEFAQLCALFVEILIIIWPGNKLENQYGEAPVSGVSF